MSTKINQTASAYPEAVMTTNGGADKLKWGQYDPANNSLLKGFAYESMGHQKQMNKEKDPSINGTAFETGSSVVGIDVSNSMSFVNRFINYGMFYPWALGFEHALVEVDVFQSDTNVDSSTWSTTNTWTESVSGNTYTFLRKEAVTNPNFTESYLYVFKVDTRLTNLEGTPASITDAVDTLNFDSSNTTLLYEHFYEIAKNRKTRDFTAEEITALGTHYVSGDQRNLRMCIAKDFEDFVVLLTNSMCEKFEFTATPANFEMFATDIISHENLRETNVANYPDFQLNCSQIDVDNIVNHYAMSFEITPIGAGDYSSPETNYGITDFNLSCDIPLQKLQTTESKQYFEEPWIEGKYSFSSSMTIGRMKDQTFQQYRDAQTPLRARIGAHNGFYMQELLIKKFTISSAGADDSDVSAEPIELDIQLACESHEFSSWLAGYTEVYQSPLVFRVRNDDPYNWMTTRNSSATLESA